jgi:hypothetical protein
MLVRGGSSAFVLPPYVYETFLPDKRILKATGPSVLRSGFDPAEYARLLPDQQQEFVRWHVAGEERG